MLGLFNRLAFADVYLGLLCAPEVARLVAGRHAPEWEIPTLKRIGLPCMVFQKFLRRGCKTDTAYHECYIL